MAARHRVGDGSMLAQALGSLPRWRNEISAMARRAKLCFALQVCGETNRAQKQCLRFVGPLEYVLMEHYAVNGCRLKGVPPPTRHTFGYWCYNAAGPYRIK